MARVKKTVDTFDENGEFKEEADSSEKSIDTILAEIQKVHGKGCVRLMSDNSIAKNVNVIPTGSVLLDRALGVGGFPRGRIVEVYGPEACVAPDTFIQYTTMNKEGKTRKNHKGGTIRRLYERFHNKQLPEESNAGRHLMHTDCSYYVNSVNEENRIISNKILDVVSCGNKPTYKVTTKAGFHLTCTQDHKFLIESGFKPLKELKVGDILLIHNNTPYKKEGAKRITRPATMVKYHPHLPTKIVDKYVYHRGPRSRFHYEASLNNMSYNEFVEFLNTKSKKEIEQLKFIPAGFHIHHKDENFYNDSIENLMLIDPTTHGQLHAKEKHNNLRFILVPSEIVSIEFVGDMETYDIKCGFPYNNYIANGIAVHNSGKTTVALHAIAEAQKNGGTALFIDAEHSLDLSLAQKVGVDTTKLVVSQPDNGEQALSILEMAVTSKKFSVAVVDSVSALVPKAEVEGDIGDSHMGLQARMMSQAMRKITGIVHSTDTLVIFINQLRQKIGVMFGNPETTTGGNALKFYASVRLDIRRTGALKDKEDIIGNKVKVKIAKNKLAPPFKEIETELIFGYGFNKEGELLELAREYDIVEMKGSRYNFNGEEFANGKVAACEVLKTNKELYNALYAKVKEIGIKPIDSTKKLFEDEVTDED